MFILVHNAAVLGSVDDVLDFLMPLLCILGAGALFSRLENHRPVLIFLCMQMVNKVGTW